MLKKAHKCWQGNVSIVTMKRLGAGDRINDNHFCLPTSPHTSNLTRKHSI